MNAEPSSDFWHSNSFWNALAGAVTAIATKLLAPDWLPVVLAVFGLFQVVFLRNQVKKSGEKIARATRQDGPS